jgi:hypothetical protein
VRKSSPEASWWREEKKLHPRLRQARLPELKRPDSADSLSCILNIFISSFGLVMN